MPEEGQYPPTPPPRQSPTPPPEPPVPSLPSSVPSTPPPPLEPFTPVHVHTPIDYNRPDSPPEDTNNPGAPFFPNIQGTPKFYPLQIPLPDGGSNTAKYIYYRKGFTEVVGMMGARQPHYGETVYLSSLRPNVSAPPFTAEQLQFFNPHDIHACTLDETLIELNSPRLMAEVTRLCTGLLALKEIDEKCEKLEEDTRKLRSEQLTVDLMLASTKRRLQYAGALATIGNEYARMTVLPAPLQHSRYAIPFSPRQGGPLEFPRLANKPHRQRCYHCNSPHHLVRDCPTRPRPACRHCQSQEHQSYQCIFRRAGMVAEVITTSQADERIRQAVTTEATTSFTVPEPPTVAAETQGRWCGRCFRTNADHDEI
ncbi:hypothetical protein H4582DRAFT_2059609 [Lactarius indigo]|nr:hypothetical protein H4582DRAFT_2059609 [Lactarius indigo]